MDLNDLGYKIKREWQVETYMWSTVMLLIVFGVGSIVIGEKTPGDTGGALIGTGLSLIVGSLAGSFSGRILGWPFGWIFGVLISLIFTPIFGNYLADSVAALSASIVGPMVGLVIGLWAEKRDKEMITNILEEEIEEI